MGNSLFTGKKIAIQGLGAVGKKLLHSLFFEGADLYVSDVNSSVLEEARRFYGATVVSPEDFLNRMRYFFSLCFWWCDS